jgi:hypothetical protein
MPLPDPQLLELKWYLQRVLAMTGAPDWLNDLDGCSEYDWDARVRRQWMFKAGWMGSQAKKI